jgi:hypothetical protein
LSSIISYGPLASHKDDYSEGTLRRFPWLAFNHVCIVWIQLVGRHYHVIDDVHWMPVVVDTGSNGTISLRYEHFLEIAGEKFVEAQCIAANDFLSTPRGLCYKLELNARICANELGGCRPDSGGRMELLSFSRGIDLFLPAELDKNRKLVWWDDKPNSDRKDPRPLAPLMGLRGLLEGGLSYLFNASPIGKPPPHNIEDARFHLSTRPWSPKQEN